MRPPDAYAPTSVNPDCRICHDKGCEECEPTCTCHGRGCSDCMPEDDAREDGCDD